MAAINPQYFTNLIASINAATSCAELQSLVTQAFTALGVQQQASLSLLATYQELQRLTTLSITSLPTVITFCLALQNYMTTQLGPYATLVAQMAAMATQVTELANAVQNAAARFE